MSHRGNSLSLEIVSFRTRIEYYITGLSFLDVGGPPPNCDGLVPRVRPLGEAHSSRFCRVSAVQKLLSGKLLSFPRVSVMDSLSVDTRNTLQAPSDEMRAALALLQTKLTKHLVAREDSV